MATDVTSPGPYVERAYGPRAFRNLRLSYLILLVVSLVDGAIRVIWFYRLRAPRQSSAIEESIARKESLGQRRRARALVRH